MSSPKEERRARRRMGPALRMYYALKYRPFHGQRHVREERRGLVAVQIDALAHADLVRALELGYCPTIARLLRDEGFQLRRWFCGLPSATPYCQAGIFHGENDGIPAFRFYDKAARRVITCNAPHGVQYIRDRIRSPGALAGGSSYVNLLDGDADTVAFTVATRERTSLYRRLGGTRMALLAALHPIHLARMPVQSAWEWLREEWERALGDLAGRTTHAEGAFPFLRVLSNVVVRELQTMAVLLDVHLGVPVIYTTYMQYDELAHHFGPSSRAALGDLRRTDARIGEIWRMTRAVSSRRYDLVILSDHGMTPAVSYRVRFRESLGTTVERILDGDTSRPGAGRERLLASHAEHSEYADAGPQLVGELSGAYAGGTGRGLRRLRDWLRSHYGLRELILPEKYRVNRRHDIVVTYSSCLALVYFADTAAQLGLDDISADPRRAHLYTSLLAHPGVGLVATRADRGRVHLESRLGRAAITGDRVEVIAGANPLQPYGEDEAVVRALRSLVWQANAGDLVLFGAYDGRDIVSFDDQVGAHGSAGGAQTSPFLITPPGLDVAEATIEDARDMHAVVMKRYARVSQK